MSTVAGGICRRLAMVLAVTLSASAACALAPGARAQETAPGVIQVAGQARELRFGFVGAGIARVQLLPIDAQGAAVESPDEPHLTPQKWRGEPAKIRALPSEPQTKRDFGAQLTFDPATWTFRLQNLDLSGGSPAVAEVRVDADSGQVSFPLDGPIFGLGQGDQPHDRRGSINLQEVGGWRNSRHPMSDWGGHLGIPFVLSPSGWGLYFHSPAGTFDLTGERGVFARQATGERGGGRRGARGADAAAAPSAPQVQPIDIFLIVASQPAGLMKAWAEISGYATLPPIWSLGYIQSHREIETADLILGVARTLREKELPCDMLIYLGKGFVDVGWNTGHGEFTFNASPFPRPEEQLKQFHDLHYRVALHVTPQGANRVSRLTGRVTDDVSGTPYDANVAAHYWSLHAPLMKLGVDAWWPDEGETRFPAGRLSRIQMYWEGPQQVFPDKRPYALHRTGAVGMQRYGGWLWSHDVKSTWAVLERHVPLGLNAVVSAAPYWGSDTGGFYQDQNRELDGELFTRWFQYSAFCPLFRSHGRDWRTKHVPYGYSEDPRVEAACRKVLDARYQLMPYTYSAFYECHETGMPIMRPLWLHYPADAAAVARGDEYLWGRDLLVAPVVKKGQTERPVYLPAGKWFDYWTEQPLDGGREIAQAVQFDTIPVYARAGAIVPHGPKEQYTEEKPNDPLTVRVYPGADGKFTMIEDDGVTFSTVPMRLTFDWNDAAKTLKVALADGSQMRAPLVRRISVKLAGVAEAKSVEFNGRPVEVQF